MEAGSENSSSTFRWKKRRRIQSCSRSKKGGDTVGRVPPSPVRIGDTIDIFSLLFSRSRDFLITNDNRQVRADDLRGKSILIYLISLNLHETPALLAETFHIKEAYQELRPTQAFEVVFVPVDRGNTDRAQDRYNDCFSDMPWPAIPFSDKLACDRVERAFYRFCDPLSWAIVDPAGKVLLKVDLSETSFFMYYGGLELLPFTDRLRSLVALASHDDPAIKGIIDLNKLLASPSRDFLLTKDHNKVPISSLKDKVVGLYFCGTIPDPPRMEAIKKVYQQVHDLGHDFEIVQINFHFHYYRSQSSHPGIYMEDLPPKPCSENNMLWMTLPFKDPCFRRLVRIFKCYKGKWKGDRLVIINPHELNINNAYYDCHGADIIQHFGLEAYPFTRRRVFELELARRKKEVKLQLVFPPVGTSLLRRRGGCYDQVPVSHLWGKRVLLVFATHSEYRHCKFISWLESMYVEQEVESNKFEVVYISCDSNESTFDECTKGMPWLVHPYSWEFAHMCRSKIFSTEGLVSVASFNIDGELLSKQEELNHCGNTGRKFPFTFTTMEYEILLDLSEDYNLGYYFYEDIL